MPKISRKLWHIRTRLHGVTSQNTTLFDYAVANKKKSSVPQSSSPKYRSTFSTVLQVKVFFLQKLMDRFLIY
jgi:hypothetical protein